MRYVAYALGILMGMVGTAVGFVILMYVLTLGAWP